MDEHYGKLGESEAFGVSYWQHQEPSIRFEAILELARDYQVLRGEYAGEPRLLRAVESFQEAPS